MGLNATAKAGSGVKRERPPEGNAKLVIVAVIDLGSHMESFAGAEAKPVHYAMVVYEMQGWADSKGAPAVFAECYSLSVSQKAKLRRVVVACGFKNPSAGFDVGRLLGRPLRAAVVHSDNGKQGEERREYCDLDMHGLADAADQLPEGKYAKTAYMPFAYSIEQGDYVESDWIPWRYFFPFKAVASPGEIISRCIERQKKPTQAGEQRQPATAGVGGSPAHDSI